jgi:hypothetical protein
MRSDACKFKKNPVLGVYSEDHGVMKFKFACWIVLVMSLVGILPASAEVMFYGYNIYSPNVMKDDSESAGSAYKMWYGGVEYNEEIKGQDAIYLRTSGDGINWSHYVRVLTTSEIYPLLTCRLTGCFAGAVNDPSVTRHFNASMQAYEWTMFYTVAVCDDEITPKPVAPEGEEPRHACNDQIWSSVSYDGGRSWQYHKLVTRGDASNQRFTATPSAHWKDGYWLVYFAESGPHQSVNRSVVHEMKVRWDRTVETYRIVYTAPPNVWTSNPEVMFSGEKAYLFFNSGGIHKVEANGSQPQWGTQASQLVVPINEYPATEGKICAAITPGAIRTSVGFDLYFSTPQWRFDQETQAFVCGVDANPAIHRWRFTD